jgi:hypothetical protein
LRLVAADEALRKLAVADAQASSDAARAERDRLARAAEDVEVELGQARRSLEGPGSTRHVEGMRDDAAWLLERGSQRLAAADDALATAREGLMKKVIERKGLERLRERGERKHEQEAMTSTWRELDESQAVRQVRKPR